MNLNTLVGVPLYAFGRIPDCEGNLAKLDIVNGVPSLSCYNTGMKIHIDDIDIAKEINPLTQGNGMRFSCPFMARILDADGETFVQTFMYAYRIDSEDGTSKVCMIQAGDNDYVELTLKGWQSFVDGKVVSDGIIDASSIGDDWNLNEIERISPLPWQDDFDLITSDEWGAFLNGTKDYPSGVMPFSASQTSIKTKMVIAYQLACNLAYDGLKVIDTTKLYGKDDSDLIWGFVDGLYQQWFQKCIDGQCSPQASMDFDMEKEDKQLNVYVQTLLDCPLKAMTPVPVPA